MGRLVAFTDQKHATIEAIAVTTSKKQSWMLWLTDKRNPDKIFPFKQTYLSQVKKEAKFVDGPFTFKYAAEDACVNDRAELVGFVTTTDDKNTGKIRSL